MWSVLHGTVVWTETGGGGGLTPPPPSAATAYWKTWSLGSPWSVKRGSRTVDSSPSCAPPARPARAARPGGPGRARARPQEGCLPATAPGVDAADHEAQLGPDPLGLGRKFAPDREHALLGPRPGTRRDKLPDGPDADRVIPVLALHDVSRMPVIREAVDENVGATVAGSWREFDPAAERLEEARHEPLDVRLPPPARSHDDSLPRPGAGARPDGAAAGRSGGLGPIRASRATLSA